MRTHWLLNRVLYLITVNVGGWVQRVTEHMLGTWEPWISFPAPPPTKRLILYYIDFYKFNIQKNSKDSGRPLAPAQPGPAQPGPAQEAAVGFQTHRPKKATFMCRRASTSLMPLTLDR